ncbi:hypothetical protein ACCO45_009147 [Purpureocillium lilacinum]|uniref:Uncharacterized protein n=1 Tax=Purpureocillium lilacinum TaxID=33203 RepID=A0ACC4DJ41_PURLI
MERPNQGWLGLDLTDCMAWQLDIVSGRKPGAPASHSILHGVRCRGQRQPNAPIPVLSEGMNHPVSTPSRHLPPPSLPGPCIGRPRPLSTSGGCGSVTDSRAGIPRLGLYGAPLRSSSPRYHTHCALLPTVGQFGSRARSRHPSCCDRQLTPSPCLSTPPSSGLAHPSARPIRSASTTTLFRRSIPPVAGMGWDAHKDGGGWARPRSHGNGQSQTHTDDMATCDGPLGLLFWGAGDECSISVRTAPWSLVRCIPSAHARAHSVRRVPSPR